MNNTRRSGTATLQTDRRVRGVRDLRDLGARGLYAVAEWITHCLVVAAILVGIRLLHGLLKLLWGEEELVFFGVIQAHELMLAADFFVLIGILTLGVACVIRAYRGEQ